MDLAQVLADLDRRTSVLDGHRPLPPVTVRSLFAALRVEHTYASNAIEGNPLTLQETRVALEGLTVGGKPLRDHLEAIDHADAFDHVRTLADQREPLIESAIRSIHALVLRRSCPDDAGRYRTVQVFISGSRHVPPDPVAVPGAMQDLLSWPRAVEEARPLPVALAAEFHARLVTIHPFVDGNERTARLASNLLLMRDGYLPARWTPEDRPEYYRALEAASLEGRYDAITLLTAQALTRTFDRYLRVFEVAETREADGGPDRERPRGIGTKAWSGSRSTTGEASGGAAIRPPFALPRGGSAMPA